MHCTQQCRSGPRLFVGAARRGHCPCVQGGRRGVLWAEPWEEDAEGQLGHIYKALLFPVRVGERETIPVEENNSSLWKKDFQVHCGFIVCM